MDRGYQHNLKKQIAIKNRWNSQKLEVGAPETKQQGRKKMLSFVTQYHPLVSTLKEALMEKRNLI